MKKLLAILLLAGCTQGVVAQNDASEKTLFEEITGIKKKTDKFNFYLNMNTSYDAMMDDGYEGSKFNIRQLRIEAKGNVNDWLSYRWRQRLNRSNSQGNNIDNAPTSIDIAGIGVKLSDKWSIFAGKQCAAYGGIEFDLNPIEIYEYSDMIDYMSNFMTGLNIGYDFAAGQQLNFQVLNSLNNTFEETYGENLKPTKTPLVYTLNWNGNFNNVFKTRWSASIMNQGDGKKLYYYALGNELSLGKFNMFLDFMYSKDDIDRGGIITGIVGQQDGHNVLNAGYLSLVTKLNYRFDENWNVFVKGMYETASVTKKTGELEKGKYGTSYGYLAGLEYYPMENSNLHFFLTYVGRKFDYTDRAKRLGTNFREDTNRLSVGFIYQLQMF